MTTTRVVDGVEVRVSNLDKVLFPGSGVTKGDVIDHVEALADELLADLGDRPLALKRYPDGIDTDGFFQKARPDGAPEQVGEVDVALRRGGSKPHATVRDAVGLVYLANLGTVELHRWLSHTDRLDEPDEVVFDLDPDPDQPVGEVRWAARRLRALLEGELDLPTRLKTSGSKGFHVHVPIARGITFETARRLADTVAAVLASRHDDRLTTEFRRDARHGRTYLDVARNAYGQTLVAAYSLRARPGAPVSTPIDWDELGDVRPDGYTIANVRRRLGQKPDPWTATQPSRATLTEAQRRVDELAEEVGG